LRAHAVTAANGPPKTGATSAAALTGYRASAIATTSAPAPCPISTAWRGSPAATWVTSWTYARRPDFGALPLAPWPRRLIA
jgi:hypothetical protein